MKYTMYLETHIFDLWLGQDFNSAYHNFFISLFLAEIGFHSFQDKVPPYQALRDYLSMLSLHFTGSLEHFLFLLKLRCGASTNF